jgi:hypothetical protein
VCPILSSLLVAQILPRNFASHIGHFESVADAWAENRNHFGLVGADVERGVDDTRRKEGRVPWAENALLAINPLLDPAGDDEEHFFLVRMFVKVVALAGNQAALDNRQLRGARMCRTADRPQSSAVSSVSLAIMNLPATCRSFLNSKYQRNSETVPFFGKRPICSGRACRHSEIYNRRGHRHGFAVRYQWLLLRCFHFNPDAVNGLARGIEDAPSRLWCHINHQAPLTVPCLYCLHYIPVRR